MCSTAPARCARIRWDRRSGGAPPCPSSGPGTNPPFPRRMPWRALHAYSQTKSANVLEDRKPCSVCSASCMKAWIRQGPETATSEVFPQKGAVLPDLRAGKQDPSRIDRAQHLHDADVLGRPGQDEPARDALRAPLTSLAFFRRVKILARKRSGMLW